MTYSEKLMDPRWQKKRLEILSRDNWTCADCYAKDKTLHVHHFFYERDPWDVENELLITLCPACHEYRQGVEAMIKKALARDMALTGPDRLMKICERVNCEDEPVLSAWLKETMRLWPRPSKEAVA